MISFDPKTRTKKRPQKQGREFKPSLPIKELASVTPKMVPLCDPKIGVKSFSKIRFLGKQKIIIFRAHKRKRN